ncbi:MAG: response regulator [Candidatus Hydrogenedentota bacterium]|nr:MAG: response regulator [Candidatus Hydrogenedentota bacterium]
MAAAITILLVSGEVEERVNLKKAFLVEQDLEVVGETDNAEEALKMAKEKAPTVIVMDAKLGGDQPDGLLAAEQISVQAPKSDIVMVAEEGADNLFMRKAMLSGVRQVLPKPYDASDLVAVVRLVAEIAEKKREAMAAIIGTKEEEVVESKMITIFSTKGGVGRTLLAINLAVALKKMTGKKVCLVDLDLQFGDIAIMMHLPTKVTISALAREIADAGELDPEILMGHLVTHEESGVSVLCAPIRPDEADLVKGNHVDQILRQLKEKFHYIVIDTPSYLSDTVLTALELADQILLLLTMELPTIKDGKLMMEIMQTFGYTEEKVKVIMNREATTGAFKKKEIEETLEAEVIATIPSEGAVVMPSVNECEPFYLRSPDSKIAESIREIVKIVAGEEAEMIEEAAGEGEAPKKKGGLMGLFGKKK